MVVSVMIIHEVTDPGKKSLNRGHHALQPLLGSHPKGNKQLLKPEGKGSSHLQSRRAVLLENASAFKKRCQERPNSTTTTLGKAWKNRRTCCQELYHNLKD